MEIEIYVCDTPAAMVQTLGGLSGDPDVEVIYETSGTSGETGDIVRYDVKPPRSAANVLDFFSSRWIVIAVRH